LKKQTTSQRKLHGESILRDTCESSPTGNALLYYPELHLSSYPISPSVRRMWCVHTVSSFTNVFHLALCVRYILSQPNPR